MRICSFEIMPKFPRKIIRCRRHAAPNTVSGTTIPPKLTTMFRPASLRNLPCISLSAVVVLRKLSLGESVSHLSFSLRLPKQILRFPLTHSIAWTASLAPVVIFAKNSAHRGKRIAELRLRDSLAHQTEEVGALCPMHDESYSIRVVSELFEFAENRRERIVLDLDKSRSTFVDRVLQLTNYGQRVPREIL